MTRFTMPSWAKWFTPRVAPSPCPAAKTRVRSPRCPGVQETPLEGEGELLGEAGPDEAGGGDRVPVEHQPGRRVRGDDLVPTHGHDQGAADDLAAVQGVIDPAGVVQRHAGADLGVDGDGARLDQPDQGGHVGTRPAAVGPDQADRAAHHVGDPDRGGRRAVGDTHRDHGPALAHHREGLLEGLGTAESLERDVDPVTPGELAHPLDRIGGPAVHGVGGAHLLGDIQLGLSAADGDDLHRAERPRHLHDVLPDAARRRPRPPDHPAERERRARPPRRRSAPRSRAPPPPPDPGRPVPGTPPSPVPPRTRRARPWSTSPTVCRLCGAGGSCRRRASLAPG